MGEQKVLSFGFVSARVSHCILWVLERDSFVSSGWVKIAHHAHLNLLINNYTSRSEGN